MIDSIRKLCRDQFHRSTLRAIAAIVVSATFGLPVAADHEFSRGVSSGSVETPDITEASGLAGSWTNPHVLWTHNDSGDRPRIFAIDDTARLLGVYELTGIRKRCDLEDIAIGPGPAQGVAYLYVGDIGDNTRVRPNITVFRIPEPAVYLSQHAAPAVRKLKGLEVLTLTYPDGSHNAEAMMIDPVSGDLFIATKQFGTTGIYRARASTLRDGRAAALEFVRSLSIGTAQMATAGDISRRGNEIIIKGYGFAKMWLRSDGRTIADALDGEPIDIPFILFPNEPQGEALGFDQFGDNYFSLSEGHDQPLYRFERTSDDGPVVPRTLIEAGATWKYVDDGSDQPGAWRDVDFDDSAWRTGTGVFEFGGDEKIGSTTTLFRSSFHIADAAQFKVVRILLLVNNGAVVHLNGDEIARVNLSTGATIDEPAPGSRNALADAWIAFTIDPAVLNSGSNTLAVEVHRTQGRGEAVTFDCQLLAFQGSIGD